MSFFIRNKKDSIKQKPKLGFKRKKSLSDKKKNNKKGRNNNLDEEIPSDSDLEEGNVRNEIETKTHSVELRGEGDDEDPTETAQEKRLRLAKKYISELDTHHAGDDTDESDEDSQQKDKISLKLHQEFLEQTGRLHRNIAEEYLNVDVSSCIEKVLRGHKLSITCVIISYDNKYIYSASKDGDIIKWSVDKLCKVSHIKGGKSKKGSSSSSATTPVGHSGDVLTLSITTDNKFLASAGEDKFIHIWLPPTMTLLHTFKGHRDIITGICFRKGFHQLYSVSRDKTMKTWNVDELAYIETLYGHQDSITAIDSLTRERAATAGGRDGSVRIWKIVEESQLIFHGHSGSIDCLKLINEESFVSGADDGSIALWTVRKKKPCCLLRHAHGVDYSNNSPYWITAVACLPHSDLVASGSRDGSLKLWQSNTETKTMKHILTIPLVGFVNSLQFSSDGNFIVAGVGQEHRLGAWWKNKQARNSVVLIRLDKNSKTPQENPVTPSCTPLQTPSNDDD